MGYPQISQISTDGVGGGAEDRRRTAEGGGSAGGQEFLSTDFTDFHRWEMGVPRNLKVAGTVVLLRIICVNLCNLWITRPLLSRIRVIRGHTPCSSGLLLNVSFLFCEEFGG